VEVRKFDMVTQSLQQPTVKSFITISSPKLTGRVPATVSENVRLPNCENRHGLNTARSGRMVTTISYGPSESSATMRLHAQRFR